jgi:hypothetical protein
LTEAILERMIWDHLVRFAHESSSSSRLLLSSLWSVECSIPVGS